MCILPIYTTSISILCLSQEERSLVESNQQMHDFYKGVIFEQQRHCGPLKSKFLCQKAIQLNTGCCYGHITGGVSIFLYVRVSILIPVCFVCLSVFMVSN